jgi:hypothetical protein
LIRCSAKKAKGFLYISNENDTGSGAVDVYGYNPKAMTLTPVGGADGFELPAGLCSDARGDVYVVDELAQTVTKFAFGTLKVIETLNEDVGLPVGCSVDPTSGNLAVTIFGGNNGSNGGVLIYTHASGTPAQHNGAINDWGSGYDPHGNLWVEGDNATGDGYVMELPKGGSFLRTATFDQVLYLPGAPQWDGKYLDISDQKYQGGIQAALYQTRISVGTLTTVKTVLPKSGCYLGTSFESWASIAASPDDLPKTQATQIAAGDDVCNYQFDVWAYPDAGQDAAQFNGIFLTFGQTYVTKPAR